MERLESIKNTLMGVIEGQMTNLQNVDAKELGEVVDMVKDIEEAAYYCTITKAMKEKENEPKMYYTMPYYPNPMYDRDAYRNIEMGQGKMYYSGQYSAGSGNTGSGRGSGNYSGSSMSNGRTTNSGRGYYSEYDFPHDEYTEPRPREMYLSQMRDVREGRSPMKRKMYMETKETHQDQKARMKELEEYMKELTTDLAEMIKDASPEEKELLHTKIANLATKIDQANNNA